MSVVKLLCLANSRKLGGRCVAGIDPSGRWWRPVSVRPTGELRQSQYTMDNAQEIRVLDIVAVGFDRPVPKPYQQENWLLAPSEWRYIDTLTSDKARQRLAGMATSGPDLLGNTSGRVSVDLFDQQQATASLAIVRPEQLTFYDTTSLDDRPQVRAKFILANQQYDLVVTDPAWTKGTGTESDARTLTTGDIFLTVSLGEPFGGSCYKLVAAVIVLNDATNS